MCEAVLNILNSDGMSPKLNSTFITLIPKKVDVVFVVDFRPIGLCNVLYKLVSKMIVNKLKPLMHLIISSNQSAFIPWRLITDNIMVAHELLHSMKKHKNGRVGKMVVKLGV